MHCQGLASPTERNAPPLSPSLRRVPTDTNPVFNSNQVPNFLVHEEILNQTHINNRTETKLQVRIAEKGRLGWLPRTSPAAPIPSSPSLIYSEVIESFFLVCLLCLYSTIKKPNFFFFFTLAGK